MIQGTQIDTAIFAHRVLAGADIFTPGPLDSQRTLPGIREAGTSRRIWNIGENITTKGLEVLRRGDGLLLKIGPEASIWITGLRTPCAQIEAFRTGLPGKRLVLSDKGLQEKL